MRGGELAVLVINVSSVNESQVWFVLSLRMISKKSAHQGNFRSRQSGAALLTGLVGRVRNRGNSPFRLTRWFAVVSLITIAAITLLSAAALSGIMEDLILKRDGAVAQDFVQSLLKGPEVQRFFMSMSAQSPELPGLGPNLEAARLEKFFAQITAMSHVIHTNVYDIEHRIVWSSEPGAKNQVLEHNPELDEALEGKLAIEESHDSERALDKPEHELLKNKKQRFVENYIPIFEQDGKTVLGVVEIYKSPTPVFETIETLVHWIWLLALLSGLMLFGALYWIMRRAERVMQYQQRQLLASESMVAVGEMASAVAHGIRNPLASIRTSAELWADGEANAAQEQARDIVSEVDRMEDWVRSLLTYAHQGDGGVESLDLNSLVKTAVGGYGRELARLNISNRFDLAERLPRLHGNGGLLTQVINSIVSNAIEAMPDGGDLLAHTQLSSDHRFVELDIVDSGVGISPERLQKAFQPFGTSKRKGLGIGLPLVKRTLERIGGAIRIESRPGHGTRATLSFPIEIP